MSLPGVNTRIKDGFTILNRTNIPLGPRVLAIGTRDTDDGEGDVADLDPYNATSEEDVIDIFGEGSMLHRAYVELATGGAQRITLVALPSDTAFNHSAGTISSATFTAANSGVSLWDTLWEAVETAQADIIVPWGRGGHPSEYEDDGATVTNAELGFHADNAASTNSWAYKVAAKIADITANATPCFAVMGIKPYTGSTEAMTPSQVSTHLALSNLYSRASMTNGIYVSVVAAEIKPLGYSDEFGYSNGAAYYAGAVASLPAFSAPTNKVIYRVEKLRYSPTRTQQSNLVDKGVVPVAVDFNRNPIWVDAQTYSPTTSDFKRLTTLRIAFDAIGLVRTVAQPFVGEASSIQARNALETQITSGLRSMQLAGALLASDFTVSYIGAENKAVIDLILTPAFELRNIEVSVSVQL